MTKKRAPKPRACWVCDDRPPTVGLAGAGRLGEVFAVCDRCAKAHGPRYKGRSIVELPPSAQPLHLRRKAK